MNNEAKMGGLSFFALWFGAAVSLAEMMTGSLLAPLGFKKGIIAILLGHLIGCFILAGVGIIGFKEKKPSLMASRISLGRYGSYLISLFNIIQLVGWTAIMLIQCARSLQPITDRIFGINNFPQLVIGVGILVAIWALTAGRGVNLINNVAVILLAILSIVVMVLVVKGGAAPKITGTISFGAALELSIVMPLSWVPLISDYTMAGKKLRGSIAGSFMGYFVGSSFMYLIGLTATLYTGNSDIVSIMTQLGMGYSALLVVVLSTVTTTFLDVYSSVMSTLNLAPRLSKNTLTILFAVVGTLLALYFPMEQYENFLYMIGSLFAPAFSVIMMDYFVFRKDRSGDVVNLWGISAAIVGTLSYYAFGKYDLIIGSTIPAMVVTSFLYALMHFAANKIRWGGNKYAAKDC